MPICCVVKEVQPEYVLSKQFYEQLCCKTILNIPFNWQELKLKLTCPFY